MASSLEIMQGLTGGQIAAILNKISGGDTEKLAALLRDEFEVQLIKRVLKLFDRNGRRIPSKDLKAAVCDPDKNFYLVRPPLETVADYALRLARFHEVFKAGPVMSAAEFEGRGKKLIAEIKNNKDLADLLNGVYLPIIVPQVDNCADCGKTLEEVFLPAAELSYQKEFPNRRFYNYLEGDLAGKVVFVSGSGHERLVERIAQSFIVAIYLPNPLQGFSVLASREQMAALPESLILSGGFDILSAMAMYPDVLARDYHTPEYDLSALAWQSPGGSLYLEASGVGFHFDSKGDLGNARDDFSSGLLFLGSA